MTNRMFVSGLIALLLFGAAITAQENDVNADAPAPADPAHAEFDRDDTQVEPPIVDDASGEIFPDEIAPPNDPVPDSLSSEELSNNFGQPVDGTEVDKATFPKEPLTESADRADKPTVEQSSERTERAALGVMLGDGPYGVWVRSVYARSPAFQAGLRNGDRIDSVNGQQYFTAAELAHEIERRQPGEPLTFHVWRNGQLVELTPELGKRSEVFASTRFGYQTLDAQHHVVYRPTIDAYSQPDDLPRRLQNLEDQVASLREQVRTLKAKLESASGSTSADNSVEPVVPEEPKADLTEGAIQLGNP